MIGTTYSEPTDICEGENVIHYLFPTEQLAPDEYYVDLIVLEYNQKVQKRHDLVTKVMFFSVEEVEHKYNMGWLTRSWGHVVFDKVELLR